MLIVSNSAFVYNLNIKTETSYLVLRYNIHEIGGDFKLV